MNTWSCRASTAVIALTVLTACENGAGGQIFDSLSAFGANVSDTVAGVGVGGSVGGDVALSQSRMAFGAVTLVAPPGFCIDKRSLSPQFALMARCDKLGVPSAAGGAPLGVISASFAPLPQSEALPTPSQTAAVLGLSQIIDPVAVQNSVTYRAIGGRQLVGADTAHWRGTARVGGQIMSLALFGSEDGNVIGSEGRSVLAALIAATKPGQ